jgi:hypothetical protein
MGVRKKLVKKRSLQLLVLIHTTLELQVRLLGGLFRNLGSLALGGERCFTARVNLGPREH